MAEINWLSAILGTLLGGGLGGVIAGLLWYWILKRKGRKYDI
jgi:hypothetical protein